MLQPQPINLVPNLQATGGKPMRQSAKGAPDGLFGEMLDHRSAAMPSKPASAKGPAEQEALPQTAEQPELEQSDNLYAFPLVTPPTEPQPAPRTQQELRERAMQIMESIVAILEGNQDNTPVDKEIVPLLEELEQILQALTPQPITADMLKELQPQLDELLEAGMARMLQTEEMADLLPKLDKLNQFIETLRGYLSPLENGNEDVNADGKPNLAEAEIIALKPAPAAEHTANRQTDSGSEGDEGKNNAPQNEANVQAPQMRVDIAPHKVLFAERLTTAEAPRFASFTAQNLFDAMVERIVQLPDAAPHMEITLKPDHLGKISVDLLLGENGITAKIIASDEGVRNQLAAHLNRLSETLAEKGIRVENVEVTYPALADKPFDQRQPGGEQQGQSGRSRADVLTRPVDTAHAWWENAYDVPLYTDEWGDGTSSVEYRA